MILSHRHPESQAAHLSCNHATPVTVSLLRVFKMNEVLFPLLSAEVTIDILVLKGCRYNPSSFCA